MKDFKSVYEELFQNNQELKEENWLLKSKNSNNQNVNNQYFIESGISQMALANGQERIHRLLSHLPAYVCSAEFYKNHTPSFFHGHGCEELTGYNSEDYNISSILSGSFTHVSHFPWVITHGYSN